MIPFHVDPSWYESYWLSPTPPRARRWRRLRASWRMAGRRLTAVAPLGRPAGGASGGSLIELIGRWSRRVIERRALAQMSDRILGDIGLTRHRALCQSRKPFWRS
jgi:uncharacterized protein YjiS (DUF1127 family)